MPTPILLINRPLLTLADAKSCLKEFARMSPKIVQHYSEGQLGFTAFDPRTHGAALMLDKELSDAMERAEQAQFDVFVLLAKRELG